MLLERCGVSESLESIHLVRICHVIVHSPQTCNSYAVPFSLNHSCYFGAVNFDFFQIIQNSLLKKGVTLYLETSMYISALYTVLLNGLPLLHVHRCFKWMFVLKFVRSLSIIFKLLNATYPCNS